MNAERPDHSASGHHDRGNGAGEQAPTDAFRAAMSQFSELGDYASYFLTAKWDGIKASVRNAGVYAALGVVGLLALGALVVSGVVLLCWGCAGAFAAIFGIWWLGDLIMGVLLLGLIGTGALLGVRWFNSKSRRQTMDRYDDRQRQQRLRFGHNVQERAEHVGVHESTAGD